MLKQGIIQPVNGIIHPVNATLWHSPLVLARKKTEDLRVYIDLRSHNDAIWVESFPLPHIKDLLCVTGWASWYITLDMKAAYHQRVLEPNSRYYTAFIIHKDTYILPHALWVVVSHVNFSKGYFSDARASHQCSCFPRCHFDFWWQDSTTWPNHWESFRNLLERGVTLSKDKCFSRVQKRKYLGHVCSGDRVKHGSWLVDGRVKAPSSNNKYQLQSFLSMCEFYEKICERICQCNRRFKLLLKK